MPLIHFFIRIFFLWKVHYYMLILAYIVGQQNFFVNCIQILALFVFIFNIFFLLKRSYQGHKFIHSKKLLSTKIICLFWNIIKMSNLRVNSMEFFYFYFVSSSRDSFVFGLIFYYYCCLLNFACMYLEYSWGNIGYSHPLGARGAPMPKNIFKMFEKFWKKLAQSYNINVSCHKISNQNSKHCSRYKNDKFHSK